MEGTSEEIHWQLRVPIFGNTVILQQLVIAIGIPFGLVSLIIALSSGKSVYTLYALGLIGALLVLTWLMIMLLYGGRYDVEFSLDRQGALCRTQPKQARKNRIINSLTVFLGLLSGKPTVAGAGMLAQARQQEFIRWSSVQKVKYKPKSQSILLRAKGMQSIALFCTTDNYPLVQQFVQEKLGSLRL